MYVSFSWITHNLSLPRVLRVFNSVKVVLKVRLRVVLESILKWNRGGSNNSQEFYFQMDSISLDANGDRWIIYKRITGPLFFASSWFSISFSSVGTRGFENVCREFYPRERIEFIRALKENVQREILWIGRNISNDIAKFVERNTFLGHKHICVGEGESSFLLPRQRNVAENQGAELFLESKELEFSS